MIGCWFFVLGSLQAKELAHLSGPQVTQSDTVFTQIFSSESELSLFIAEELKITESITSLNKEEVDSLHLLLNTTKQLLISKADLVKFLGYSVTRPETKLILGQGVELSPKTRVQRLELDAIKGDSFTLNYVVEEGIGNAAYIEVLLNQVRVAKSLTAKRGKKVNLEFVASETGVVEIVLRSMGPFDEKGNIEVHVTPRTEQVELKKITSPKIRKEIVDAIVADTLYLTVVDEQAKLTHRANLKGNSVLQKQLDFGAEDEVLGFAVFFFPYGDKDNLQISRRETYREDPLEDFSMKELIGKSFTYLPEYDFPELAISITDAQRKVIWSNGSYPAPEKWKISPNSKANYAFFQSKEKLAGGTIQMKFSNISELYDLDFGLKIIKLIVKNFAVKQEVDVEEFEETILLTIL
ncbi:MAG: hypothetical protein NBV61_04810 [Algoriphagus sp.]|nr:hypothetical protein [Algoriphagus sp.]